MTDCSGRVIWITGFSGSGKTTLARNILPLLPPTTILLDGDAMREVLGQTDSGYGYATRKQLAFVYARLAGMLAGQGFTVVVATISLFHDLHTWNRENLPGYLEVFLDVPDQERLRRDPKGLYAAHPAKRNGPMACQLSAEIPKAPHVRISPDVFPTVQDAAKAVLDALSIKSSNV